MFSTIQRFFREEDAASAIEYGLLAALIAVAITVGATALGTALDDLFNQVATQLNAV